MADNTTQTVNGKPLHRLSWAEKIANDRQYFKTCCDYYIGASHFTGFGTGRANMQTMYSVYNNQIPIEWFNHVTNPLSAQNPQHAKFPAKIRPTNILRTNIDLLLGEWPKRPFKYRVENVGEDGYNKFMEGLNNAVNQNLQQLFAASAQQQAQSQGGAQEGEISEQTPDQIPMPQDVQASFSTGYKDKQAIKGQKWMERALVEYQIKRKIHKMFKDWLIAGETISLKNIVQGELDYRRLSPLYSDYDKSPETDFIEDGDWFTHIFFMTASDVVDMFYDELDDEDHVMLENYTSGLTSPSVMYDYLTKNITTQHAGKIPVYMTLWKGRKKIYHLKYKDPTTGEDQDTTIDEAEYPLLPPDQKKLAEQEWVNESYETWRIGDKGGIYVRKRPVLAQRNAMNNFSVCKLPANGRKYSDTHSENISVLQVGIPYLIMYMIVGRTLELTIAKSKGKILVMDNNAIPRTKGWNEEKFFYYSDAMGYALIDRNQIGVDKSFNQYQVLDMSLFDQIKQLIELQQHFKQEWDDIIGISRQRKAETMTGDTASGNERAIFQSTVITDMIFAGFEEFVERELQGLLDLSKFVNADGVRRLYNGSALDDILLEIDPEDYCNASLGLFVTDNPQDSEALNAMKAQAPHFIQNGVKPTTILELLQAGNVAELRSKLREIEGIEQQLQQSQVAAEQQAAEDADQRKERFLEYEKMLEEQLLNTEYDRKEDLEYIKGDVSLLMAPSDGDNNDNGIPDSTEIMKANMDREKLMSTERMHQKDTDMKSWELRLKANMEQMKQKSEDKRQQRELATQQKQQDLEMKHKKEEHAMKMAKGAQDIRKAKMQAKKAAAPKPKPKK